MTAASFLAAQAIAASDRDGVTRQDITRTTGLTDRQTENALRAVRADGGHFAGSGTRYRYFASAEWAEAYASPEQVARRAEDAHKQYLMQHRDRNRKARAAAGKKSRSSGILPRQPKVAAVPFVELPAVIPDHVKVQRLPGFIARSFAPEPTFVGEFTAAWRAKVSA